jgi:CO/xanthine dehydrogenase Mo-binding subunit
MKEITKGPDGVMVETARAVAIGREFRAVNKRQRKVEGEAKATGFCQFSGDIYVPGMLHARVFRSPIPHGKIKHIDTSKAKALPGVKAVLTGDDVPDTWVKHCHPLLDKVTFYDSRIFATDKVRYVGDRVAAVAATSLEIAEEACRLIEVEYEELPALLDCREAIKDGAVSIHERIYLDKEEYYPKNNCLEPLIINIGDVDEGFKKADLVVENEYYLARVNNAMLERPCCLMRPLSNGGLEVWGNFQSIYGTRESLAKTLQLPLGKVKVHKTYLGGSFGAHITTNFSESICGALALKARAPVRLEHSREECFRDFGRHPGVARLKTGVTKDGTLTAMSMWYLDDTGAYNLCGPFIMYLVAGWYMSMYRCPSIRFEGYTVYVNTPPTSAMRGAGNPQQAFAVEQQMDIVAEKLGMDPIEFRLKNHIRLGDTFYGQGPDVLCVVESCGTEYLLEECKKRIGYEKGYKNLTPFPDKPWIKRGIGITRGFHTSGCGTARPSDAIMDWTAVMVKLNEDGTATLMSASADLGSGNTSVHAAMVAEELGIPYENVIVAEADTDTTLYDVVTHASRATYCGGLAVQKAAGSCKEMLLEFASRILEVPAAGLDVADNKVIVKGMPSESVSIQMVCETARDLNWGNPFGAESVRATSCPPHFVTTCIEVDVDTETGEVTLVRAIGGCDVGTPININNVEGQVIGGLHMGSGYALTEESVIGPDGNVLNPDFRDYKMLTALDMPRVEVIRADTYEPTGPFGAKGMGEGATNPVAPAVANAIYNAIGIRIKETPITPEKILKALGKL